MNKALIALATALSQEPGLSEQTRQAALEVLAAAREGLDLESGYAALMGVTSE